MKLFLFFLFFCILRVNCEEDCPENLRLLCHEQSNCGECMLAHRCCHWCYSQSTSSHRCDFIDALTECSSFLERNRASSVTPTKNLHFTTINQAEDAIEAIQMKPQSFRVILRKDTPVNITFTYKAARNYPLELYYLGDLSYSMKSHLDTLKSLGSELGRRLEQLTKHYRLAYGSFLDKPGMPFIYTDPANLDNPCRTSSETCEKTYLFKHSLNFTSDTEQFFAQVRNSKISANVDDMDGALEAIFQILVCGKKFGWSDYSRKIILLSTDSLLHIEGDGLLAGASEVNLQNLCLVDLNGDHTQPLKYDYPSLGQIKSLLRMFKTSLIVAVTQDKVQPYQRMRNDILDEESFIGVLQNSSKNILDLVGAGFHDFMQKVHFSVNTSHAPELATQFYGDCGQGHFNVTSNCQNVREEVPIQFKLEVALKDATKKFQETLVIKEQNINEVIEVMVEYVGENCECANITQAKECENGVNNCGDCVCDLGWTGEFCAESCIEDVTKCRKTEYGLSCSGVGDCICGKCSCPTAYTGEFCEYECPMKNQKKCNGKGVCYEGTCICDKGFKNRDCSCEEATHECRLSSDTRDCNGNGMCECNKCQCQEGFSGKYCEIFNNKNMLCEKYEKIVLDYYTTNGTMDNGVVMEEWTNNINCESETCSTVYYTNVERCLIDYCYHSGTLNTIHLGTTNKKCVFTAQAKGITLGLSAFLAVLLGGLLIICIKKVQIYREEKAEYKRFIEAQTVMKEENPLYVSPVSTYRNPMLK